MRPRSVASQVDSLLGSRRPTKRERDIIGILTHLASDPETCEGMPQAEVDLLETLALRLFRQVGGGCPIVLEVGPEPLYVVIAARIEDAKESMRHRRNPPPSDL